MGLHTQQLPPGPAGSIASPAARALAGPHVMESRKTLVPPPEARPRAAVAWRWLARHPVPGCWDRPLLTSIPPDPLAPDMASAAHFLSERWQRAWRPQKDEPYGVLRLRAPGRFTLRISLLEHGGAGGAGAGSSLWAHIKSETRGREEGTWLHPPADNKAGPAQSGQSRAGFPPAGGLLVAGTPSAAVSSSRAHVPAAPRAVSPAAPGHQPHPSLVRCSPTRRETLARFQEGN